MALRVREDSRVTYDLGIDLNNCTIHQNGEYRRSRFEEKGDNFVSVHCKSEAPVYIKRRYPSSQVNMRMWSQVRSGLKSEKG